MKEFFVEKGFVGEVTVGEMNNFAEAVLQLVKTLFEENLKEKSIFVALSGNLGAGKTTFSQNIAKLLGISESVTSPTFVIQKTYKTKDLAIRSFVHIDAYRLEESREITTLGFDNLLKQPKGLIFVEWPEKIPEYTEMVDLRITFEVSGEGSRTVSVS